MRPENRGPILCVAVTPALQRTLQFANVVLGGVNRAKGAAVSPAGKAVNVARALKILGEEPLLTGFLGGATGRMVQAMLRELGITTDMISVAQSTRVCTTLVDEAGGPATELVEESAVPEPAAWQALEVKVGELLPRAGMVVLSGALPPGGPAHFYTRVLRAARPLGLPVLVDARGETLRAAAAEQPFLVKLNAHELAETGGTARDLLAAGAQWVLITDGARPAHLYGAKDSRRFQPPVLRALNAVGSGDATTAGLAWALRRGQSVSESVRYGLACGGANALTLTPCDIDPTEAARLLPEVRTLVEAS